MEPAGRGLVIGLSSALGLALLAIAFLLGRVTATPAVVPVAPSASVVSAAPATAPAAGATAPPGASAEELPPNPPIADSSATAAPATGVSALETLTLSEPSAPATSEALTSKESRERQQVAAYFADVDRLEDMGAGDPQAFGSSMMESLSSGDFTRFDALLAKARDQRQRLQTVSPPPTCAEHHRLALGLSADSVAMLERLKAALMKGDSMALMGIASDGRTLEAKANQLKSMGETIKRQAQR